MTGVTGETCVFVLQRTSKNEQNATLAAVGGQRRLPEKKPISLHFIPGEHKAVMDGDRSIQCTSLN